jgi:FtsP/CotA-like multicopper oxidase with cupredoxin domain
MHDYADQFFPGLPSTLSLYKSILVNGRAKFFDVSHRVCVFLIFLTIFPQRDSQIYSDVPLTTYNVVFGKRYRFRLINAASNICSFIVKFEGHMFSVIASDGSSLRPTVTESLHITSGERYDIVLEANQTPRDYVVQIKSYLPCSFKGYAILRYHDEPTEVPTTLSFIDLNEFNLTDPEINERTFNTPNPKLPGISIAKSASLDEEGEFLRVEPDKEFHLFLQTPTLNNTVLFNTPNTIKWMGKSIKQLFIKSQLSLSSNFNNSKLQ